MKLHEYQAKEIFKTKGLPIPPGKVFDEKSLSEDAISKIKPRHLVVKAQVHAGGRGKAGGVKIVETPHEAYEAAKKMF